MSLLSNHYSAGEGYAELAANAVVRGFGDIEYGIGAVLGEFRAALKAVAARGSVAMRGMGLYDVAMAAGRPGLGRFAPVAGVAGRPISQKSRAVTPVGEPGFVAAGQSGAADAGALATRRGDGVKTSYRAVVAQARQRAAAGRARRDTERAALHLPARGASLAGLSFAPPSSSNVVGGGLRHPAMRQAEIMPGLHPHRNVHSAMEVAEAASGTPEACEDQKFAAMPALVPEAVAQLDIGRALESYFFRQSRLPPTGGAGFNPLLSPAWAGLKIPG